MRTATTRSFALSFILLGAAGRAESYDNIKLLEPIKTEDAAKPVAVAASASRYYVVDEKKSQVLLYDASGKILKAAGRYGSDKSGFSSPRGIAVSADGSRVFVADTGNSRVQILDADGNFVGSFGVRGSEAGQLKGPQSVALGADGRVYVADTGNNRVQVFTDEGILLFQFGSSGIQPGQFKEPTRVAVDPSDNVYVLDSGNGRIQKFDASAKFVREFSLLGNDFAVDSYGFLYVLDGKGGKVMEQNAEGFIMGKFGSSGSGPGQLKRAEGVAVAPNGLVLVVDTGNQRVHRVELTNKAKTAPLPPNLETKLLASGPAAAWDAAVEALAVDGAMTFGWVPKDGQIVVLDENGKEKSRIGSKNAAAGPSTTKGSLGLAFSPKLGLYVSDTPNNRIQRFVDGVWKENIAESTGFFDSKKKEGRVKDPRGVAINDQGTIYVADAGNRRVDAFSPEGVFLFGIGPTGVGALELMEPTAVAWDKNRFLYIVDKGLKKIIKCEPSGAYITSWGVDGDGPGQLREPVSVAFDGRSYVYVLDAKLRRVSVFSTEGKWMTDLFAGGDEKNSLKDPVALAVQGSRLLIADKGRGKVLVFDLRVRLAAPTGLTAATKDGAVSLAWKAVPDAWTDGYKIQRAPEGGEFADIGQAETARYEDTTAAAYAKYLYRAVTKSKTGDLGAPTPAVEIMVTGAFNKAPVELSTITIGNIFSANYKWYLKNPVGMAVVTNNVNAPFENVKLTFRLKDFMDFGYDTEIKKLEPQQRVEVPLIATLNNKVLDVSEDTPVQAEFTLTYFESGKQMTVSLTKPLRIYSKNAITWDKPQRIATFVTPKDPPVLEFALSAVPKKSPTPKSDILAENVVNALHIWDALAEYGVGFVSNPSAPYEATSEDPNFPVDYTQFPRETLKRKSGQCDELSTLLVTMLQGKAINAALLDYPGHMALLFDSGSDEVGDTGFPESQLVKRNGTWWVPLEATMIGKPFQDAVAKAAQAYKAESEKGKVKVLEISESWKEFEPATLPATDFNPEAPKMEARKARFEAQLDAILDQRHVSLKKAYEARLKEKPGDAETLVELGLLEYQAGKPDAASEQFNKALASDPQNIAALVNLGNLAFGRGEWAEAEAKYKAAVAAEEDDADLWLNLVRVAAKQKNKDKAQEYGQKAIAVDARSSTTIESWLKNL